MEENTPLAAVGSGCGTMFSTPLLATSAFAWGDASGLKEWIEAPLEASLASVSCSCCGVTASCTFTRSSCGVLLAMVGGEETNKERKVDLD